MSFVIGDQEPLGLETLAGMLPQHPIQLLDMRFDGPDLDSIIRDFQPEIVGITGVTCEYNKVCEVLTRIKDLSPETLTVVGGAHATLTPEDFNREFVDVVVIGEGEVTFTEIVEAHEKKTDLSQISGIALRRDGKSVLTRKREVMMDLNTLPLPNRKITEAYRRHYSRGTWRPMGSLYSTRGCPYRCTFCCTWIMGDKKFRIRGVDSFIRDLASMDEHYVFVADDNTIHDTKYSMELVQAVKDSGLEKEYHCRKSRFDREVEKHRPQEISDRHRAYHRCEVEEGPKREHEKRQRQGAANFEGARHLRNSLFPD